MSQGFITLDECIKSYLNRSDRTMNDFAKLLQIAIDGLAEFHYDVLGAIKSVELPINQSTASIDFPDDYVNYTKVGMCINGNIITLSPNPNICTVPQHDDCGDLIKEAGGNLKGTLTNFPQVNGQSIAPYGYNYYGWEDGITRFGWGGGYSMLGYYKEDRENRRFVFNSDVTEAGPTIILEYITSGYVPGKITMIDAQAKEAMIAWLHWNSLRYKPEMVNVAAKAEREFNAQRHHLQVRKTAITIEEFVQATRRSYKQTIKN